VSGLQSHPPRGEYAPIHALARIPCSNVAAALPPDLRKTRANWGNRGRLIPARPAAVLHGLVHEYRGFRDDAPVPPAVQRELPSAVVPVIIEFGAGWHVATPADSYQPQHVRPEHTRHACPRQSSGAAGPVRGVQIDLLPIGARQLLGVPMHELANRVVPLDALLGCGAHELAEQLAEAGSWTERCSRLDAALTQRLGGHSAISPEVAWAWQRLEQTAGATPVQDLCIELGWSRKRLVARFRNDIGLGPKTAARVIRFHRLSRRLRARSLRDGWADLAIDLGYADQGASRARGAPVGWRNSDGAVGRNIRPRRPAGVGLE